MVQASEKCFASMIATAAVVIEIDTAHFVELAYTGFYKSLILSWLVFQLYTWLSHIFS